MHDLGTERAFDDMTESQRRAARLSPEGPPMADNPAPNPDKDPEDWTTGEEPMTGPQRSYLHTLAQEAGVEVPVDMTKAEASKMIDELQEQTGRGRSGDSGGA